MIEQSQSAENDSLQNTISYQAEQDKLLDSEIPERSQEDLKETLIEVLEENKQKDLLITQMDRNGISDQFDNGKSKQKENSSTFSASDIIVDEYLLRNSIYELISKFQAFEALISKKHYLKATIVAEDIDRFIESFDALNYFPKLFAKYFSLLAEHVPALSEQDVRKESLQVRALEKLYRTNLEMFIEW